MTTGLRLARALLAGVAVLALAAPAGAAPRAACRLLTDPVGDAKVGVAKDTPAYAVEPTDPSLDVLSADVASNASAVTVAIRLAGYERLDLLSPGGRNYRVELDVSGWPYPFVFWYLERAAALPEARWASIRPSLFGPMIFEEGDARVAVDPVAAEIRLSVPLAYFRPLAYTEPYRTFVGLGARGRTVTAMYVFTDRFVGDATNNDRRNYGLSPLLLPPGTTGDGGVTRAMRRSDTAVATQIRYASASPSCVPVGR